MARSFMRTPISGNANASSDKWFKRQASRRLRVAVRVVLRSGSCGIFPHPHEVASAWDSAKDGKRWIGDLPRNQRWRLMRK